MMTEEASAPAVSKATRNERRKLLATFFNNLAVGFVLAAFLQPALALVQQTRAVQPAEWLGSVLLAAVSVVCILVARVMVGGLED